VEIKGKRGLHPVEVPPRSASMHYYGKREGRKAIVDTS
jgi:hypothetical protein